MNFQRGLTLVEMALTTTIIMGLAGWAVRGTASAYKAQAGASAQGIITRCVVSASRMTTCAAATGRLYGFSIGVLAPEGGSAGLADVSVVVPWYVDSDRLTGELGTIKTYQRRAQFLEVMDIPESTTVDAEPVRLRMHASESIGSYFFRDETDSYLHRQNAASAHDLSAGKWIHVVFEPMTGRPHVVFNSDASPETGPGMVQMFTGSGVHVGNNTTGYGSGVKSLSDLGGIDADPFELNIHDRTNGRKVSRMVIFPSGSVEMKGVRG